MEPPAGGHWGGSVQDGEKKSTHGAEELAAASAAGSDAEFLVTEIPLFPMLQHLEFLWPSKLILLGAVIEAWQPVGYVWNARWEWGGLMDSLGEAVYFVQLPFWDPAYVHSWTTTPRVVVFWVFVGFALLLWFGFGMFFRAGGEDAPERLLTVSRIAVHLATGALLQPMSNFLLTLMVCGDDGKTLWLVSDMDCWSATHIVHLLFGIITLVGMYLIAYTVRTMIYNDSPYSLHILARAHSRLDEAFVVFQLVSSVLYFELLASGRPQLFAALQATACFMLAAAYALLLPYYNHGTNEARSASLLFAGVVSAMAASPEWELTHRGADLVTVAAAAAGCWFTAVLVCRKARISPKWLGAIEAARSGNRYPGAEQGRFPQRLPWYDLRWGRHKRLQDHLAEKGDGRAGSTAVGLEALDGDGDPKDGPLQILCPYITNVLLPTDVELSSRFLREYAFAVASTPTPKMLAFASRIYTKGMRKYATSSLVHVHFVSFLHYYCAEHQHALLETRIVQGTDCSVVGQYRLYRLTGRLKQLLSIRDNTHQKVFIVARKLHKQALSHMATFWSKLLSEKADTLDLAHLANTITKKREEGLKLFERAVRSRFDHGIAVHYAQFLEQIMLDSQAAQDVRERLRELQQLKVQSGATTGGMQSRGAEGNVLQGSKMLESQGKGPGVQGGGKSKTIANLQWHTNLVFFMFLLAIVGFGVFDAILSGMTSDTVAQLHEAGQVRMLAVLAAFYARELQHTAGIERQRVAGCKNVQCSVTGVPTNLGTATDCVDSDANFPDTARLKKLLLDAIGRLREGQNKLTHGAYKATFGPLVRLYKNPEQEVVSFTSPELEVTETAATHLIGLWQLGTYLISELEAVQRMNSICLSYNKHVAWLDHNSHENIALAFNKSLDIASEQHKYTIRLGTVVLVCLFAVSMVIVFFVYLVLIINFLKIGAAKMATLNLFSLIPKNTLETIYQDAQEKVQHFDDNDSKIDDDMDGDEEATQEQEEEEVPGRFHQLLLDKNRGEGRVIKHHDADDDSDAEGGAGATAGQGAMAQAMMVAEEDGPADGGSPSAVPAEKKEEEAAAAREQKHEDHAQEADERDAAADEEAEKDGEDGEKQEDDEGLQMRLEQGRKGAGALGRTVSKWIVNLCVALGLCGALVALVLVVIYCSEIRGVFAQTRGLSSNLKSRVEYQHMVQLLPGHVRNYLATCDLTPYAEYWQLRNTDREWDAHYDLALHKDSVNHRKYLTVIDARRRMAQVEFAAFYAARPWCQLRSAQRMNRTFEDIKAAQAAVYRDLRGVPARDISHDMAGHWYAGTPWSTTDQGDVLIVTHAEFSITGRWLHGAREWVSFTTEQVPEYGKNLDQLGPGVRADLEYVGNASINGSLSTATVYAVKRERQGEQLLFLRVEPHTGGEVVEVFHDAAETAHYALGSTAYSADEEAVHNAFMTMKDTDPDNAHAWTLFVASLSCATVTLACVLSILLKAKDHNILGKVDGTVHYLALWVTFTAVVLLLILLPLSWDRVAFAEERTAELAKLFHAEEKVLYGLEQPRDAIIEFLWTGNVKFAQKALAPASYGGSFSQLMAMHVPSVPVSPHVRRWWDDNARRNMLYGATQALPEVAHGLDTLQRIALSLSYWSLGLELDERLRGFRWNFRSEESYHELASDVDTAQWYNSTESDSRLDHEKQADLVRSILYSDVYKRQLSTAVGLVTELTENREDSIFNKAHDEIDSAEVALEAILVAALALSVVALVAFCSFVLCLVVAALAALSLSGTGLSAKKASRSPEALFSHLTFRVRVSLLLVSLLLAVLVAVGTITLQESTGMAPRLDRASAREWLTARSIMALQDLQYESMEGRKDNDRHRIYAATEDLIRAEEKLFFGSRGAKGYGDVGEDSKVDTGIFGGDLSLDHRLRCHGDSREAGEGDFASAGVDLELRKFIFFVLEGRFTTHTYGQLKMKLEELLQKLEESTQVYVDNADSEVTRRRFMFFAVLISAAVLLLVEYVFIFQPMIGNLVKEEEGTRLMLKMIPQKVRESVGAINEYLETGQVTQDQRLQEVNEVVTQLSTVPTIVCDSKGIIIRFSRAAKGILMYDEREALGKNVKLIMPEDYAKHHDFYLARYRKTGVKRVIGAQTMARAQRKDTTVFPVRLAVKEFRQGRKSIFIGFLEDITVEIETERAAQLNDAVSMTSSVPVICINDVGTVLRWNDAAEDTFGYKKSEVMGHNVKMIQPPEVARIHDNYLARYKRTKVRHVIDQKIKQRAVRKNGDQFPCEIFIKEMRWKEGESIFIAYVRDVTEEFQLRQQVLMNDCVVEVSIVPLIMMDTVGTVKRFSPAAERTWGYSAGEVVNRNVKMLMPEEIAVRHDGYLSSYLKTRVKHVVDTTRNVKAKRKDGTFIDIQITVKEIQSDGAFPTLYIGYAIDRTQELLQSDIDATSGAVADLSPVPLITITEDGTVRTFSRAAAQVTGFTPDEMIGNNITIIQPPDVAARHHEFLQRYLDTGEKRVIDTTRRVTARHKDGTQFPVQICIREVKTEDGNIYVGYLTDIRDVHRMERANLINDAATDLVTVPLIVINSEGQVQLFSKAAVREFGYERDEVLLHNVKMLMPDEIASEHDGYLQRYRKERDIRGRKSTVINTTRRIQGLRKDGLVFAAEISVRVIEQRDAGGIYVAYVRDVSEEIQIESEYAVQAAIVNQSPIPLVVIDVVGTIQTFSNAAVAQFGYSAEEVLGKNVKLLQPKEIADQHDRFLKTYLKTGIKNVIDTTRAVHAQHKAGNLFPAEITVREIHLKDGCGKDANVYVGYIRDTTRQYILEEANAINAASTDLSVTPMISINVMGTVLQFSQAAEHDFGYKSSEIIGKNVKTLMPEEIAIEHDGYLAKYRKTGVKTVIDNTRFINAKRKNGQIYPAEVSVRELQQGGKDTVLLGYVRDVTQLHLLEEEKKRSDSLVELSSIPLVTMDIKGTMTMFNHAAAVTWGYKPKDAIGQNVKMLQPPEIASQHDKYLRAYAKTGNKHVIDTTRRVNGKRADGKTFPIEIMVRELKPEGPSGPSLFVGFLRDVTEEQRMLQANMLSDAITDMLVIPTIVIDHEGWIQAFSNSAVLEFQLPLEDAIGQNIKLLQPQEVADKHDGYLQRYLRTQQRHVIGTTREVTGKRSDGTTFPAEICVKEIRKRGAMPKYVGYVRNVSLEKQIIQNRKFTDMIIEMAPMALISMDTRGTVQRFNQAAALLFDFAVQEVVGQNIKMLMPEEVAVKHDEYLAAYLRTGVKNVIDTTRHVPGRRKTGEQFPAEITVREITMEDCESLYIGFISDATRALQLLQQHTVNDTVTALSPIPIIAMDQAGIISTVSDSVLQVFDYPSRDALLGHNVKMLMFPDVACKHDGYLSRYLETGEKHIIDSTRQVDGMTRTGNVVPVEVSVREILRDGTRSYIGYARDLRPERDARTQQRVMDFLNDHSPVSVLAIDPIGTILKANKEASSFFGWSVEELEGGEIERLQPDVVAHAHKGYLKRYLDDGIKRVVDKTRRVTAKTRIGAEVPVEIRVSELQLVGKGKVFVGSITDVSDKVQLEGFVEVNEAIQELVQEAMICIDSVGTILRFNREASNLFKVDPKDVIGQNIKMLMPPETAKDHDGYLKRYMETGVKRVVDTTRDVVAQTVPGDPFDAQIMVKEVKIPMQTDKDGMQEQSVFVGFITRDG